MRIAVLLLLLPGLLAAGCGRSDERSYQLAGQILEIRPDDQQVTIRHGDIKGFMPAMTMPFRVRSRQLLEGRAPGDLVQATLVVRGTDAWITEMTKTGAAPLPADAAPAVRMLGPGDPVPDAELTTDRGEPLRIAGLKGRPAAITFVYTRCPFPDFCPTLDRRFAEVQEALRKDPALRGTQLVSISIDPTYDTPEVLRAHAERLGADSEVWRFATGDERTIAEFGRPLGMTFTGGSPSPANLLHNLRTVVVDSEGRVAQIFSGTDWSADDLASALRRASADGGTPAGAR